MGISGVGCLVGCDKKISSAGQGEGMAGRLPSVAPLWSASADFAELDQQKPGSATLLSLLEEANQLLERLSAVGLHLEEGVNGSEICLYDGDERVRSLPAGDVQMLLGKVRVLQRLLTSDTPSSGMITSN